MSFSDLIQMYFERSFALQWYWTIYVLVIGGVLGFSTIRQRPDIVTTVLVAILFACFAYKNLGAIEATATEREAILTAITNYPESADDDDGVRKALLPTLQPYDIPAARNFHLACNLLTILYLAAAEWRRRKTAASSSAPVAL